CVTLFGDTAAYPALAEALGQRAGMVLRSMEEEYDNLCVMVREDLSWPGMGEETWLSTFDDQVRRADGVVLSLLNDSYADHGMVQDFRGMHGSNYDVATGQELALTDVVEINNDLALAVAAELNRHQWAGDVDYTEAVELYFANTPYDGFAWTLDYNGLTFYFGDGDLEEPGNGRKSATVSFAEHPALFQEKFLTAPAAYLVELPLDHPFFTDLDGDGDTEELSVTALYDADAGCYTRYGVYAEANGAFRYEDCHADGLLPYYLRTAEGSHFLYLFFKDYEGMTPFSALTVYDVNYGTLTEVGSVNVGPGYLGDGSYRLPTDPGEFYLDNFDGDLQEMTAYAVGAMGLPAPRQ
ncbi:MAG: hypothetical protein IJF59_03325, partial [Clostridia bacterium]|nr:hypothetical protein [Clostridia bacterium]